MIERFSTLKLVEEQISIVILRKSLFKSFLYKRSMCKILTAVRLELGCRHCSPNKKHSHARSRDGELLSRVLNELALIQILSTNGGCPRTT